MHPPWRCWWLPRGTPSPPPWSRCRSRRRGRGRPGLIGSCWPAVWPAGELTAGRCADAPSTPTEQVCRQQRVGATRANRMPASRCTATDPAFPRAPLSPAPPTAARKERKRGLVGVAQTRVSANGPAVQKKKKDTKTGAATTASARRGSRLHRRGTGGHKNSAHTTAPTHAHAEEGGGGRPHAHVHSPTTVPPAPRARYRRTHHPPIHPHQKKKKGKTKERLARDDGKGKGKKTV